MQTEIEATLYHYCSNETLLAILSSRRLRLSDLRLSNDRLEGRLVRERIENLANNGVLPSYANEHLKNKIKLVEDEYRGFGFCLSTEGDLLSQWRGYADDGHGVSIGFSKSFLQDVANSDASSLRLTNLQEVVYDEMAQLDLLRPAYLEIEAQIRATLEDKDLMREIMKNAMQSLAYEPLVSRAIKSAAPAIEELFRSLYMIKGDAFSEEKEWRLLCVQHVATAQDLKFRSARDRLIAFREISMEAAKTAPAINEIILGPKNITSCEIVSEACNAHGYQDLAVRRSRATYR